MQKIDVAAEVNAIFKDCMSDCINLCESGFENISIAHHNNVLKVGLGCSNAQCQYFECTAASDSVFECSERKKFKLESNMFSFRDENAQFV